MNLLFLIFSLLSNELPSTHYAIRVEGNASAAQRLVQVINCEAPQSNYVQFQLINPEKGEHGMYLARRPENQGLDTRENRFQCALNYLMGDSSKTFRLRLVENDPNVLISDARSGIIDIADVEKFNAVGDPNFTAFNILLHELYEQYQLQVIEKNRFGRTTEASLKLAHRRAIQKESNFYSLTMLRSKADIHDEYIHIEFTNRINSSHHTYYAYFRQGNIDRIETIKN